MSNLTNSYSCKCKLEAEKISLQDISEAQGREASETLSSNSRDPDGIIIATSQFSAHPYMTPGYSSSCTRRHCPQHIPYY